MAAPGTAQQKARREIAQLNSWMHNREEAIVRRLELLGILGEQWKEAKKPGQGMWCACCRLSGHWSKFYRCHECDLWLCPMCARPHFATPSEDSE